MYNFKKVEPIYTGGGITVFLGELDNNRFFMADDSCFDVRIIDKTPYLEDGDTVNENAWYDDWQQKHLIEDLMPNENLSFFEDLLTYVRDNGIYYDVLEDTLQEIDELKTQKN